MPIRWRLTLWFSVILCTALILSGVIIYTVLNNHLHSEVDDNLRVYAAEIKDYIGSDIVITSDDYDVVCEAACACSPALREFGSPGVHVRLIDSNGNIVGRSENLGDLELPVEQSLIERGLAGEAGAADIVIAYLPEASMGTALEMVRAYDNGVPILTISPMAKNWFIKALSARVFPTLEAFCDWMRQNRLGELVNETSA